MVKLLRTSIAIKFLLFVLVFLLVTDLAIFLDISVLRQVLGFLFFTIIPGLLILYALKLSKLGLIEKTVLSVGLSVVFLMLFGIAIDQTYFALGYATPLATMPLVISFSIILLVLSVIGYIRNKEGFSFSLSDFKLSTTEKTFLLVPAFFPLLSIVGMHLMNTTDNNTMLMVLLFLIPAYVILLIALNHKVPHKSYPLIIFLMGISLLLMYTLRSSHIIGTDNHLTYYLFQLTSSEQHWSVFWKGSAYSACLSITLLPAIYQSVLNINSEYLFKVLYPLLFSISPLVVYIISRKYIGNSYAFLVSFFFMSQVVFFTTDGSPRTNTAILFFALAIMSLFQGNITGVAKRALFIIFAVSCVVSHYSTTYIFFFVLLLTWMGMEILPRLTRSKREAAVTHGNSTGGISITVVALFFAVLFFWYAQVTEASFTAGVNVIHQTFINLNQFFLLESRGGQMLVLMGEGIWQKEIPRQIDLVFTWLTLLLVAIGVLSTILRYKTMVSIPHSGRSKLNLLQSKIDTEYFALSLACSAILAFSLILPIILSTYGGMRLYFQMMAVLSPFFVIGGITVAKFLKSRPQWIILVVLIPYFMCTTGTMHQIFDFPKALTLNSEGFSYDYLYVHEQEISAAKWLRDNGELPKTRIFTDYTGYRRLLSQGGIRGNIDNASLVAKDKKIGEGYIYLRYCNVVEGKLLDAEMEWYDIAEYQDKFVGRNKIYANGGSEIYK